MVGAHARDARCGHATELRELHTRLRVERAGPGRVEWAHLRLRLQGRQRRDGASDKRIRGRRGRRAAGIGGW